MELTVVNTPNLDKLFCALPRMLYKHDEAFVSPLDNDIAAIFDATTNNAFKHGKAKRWILFQDKVAIGRIAAFYNTLHEKDTDMPGGVGFFECVDNIQAAHLLFDEACQWLISEKRNRVEAPINFGEKDKFWGLLVSGFNNPSFQQNYNFPYYQKLFESYGFVKSTEQTTSEIGKNDFQFERFNRLSARVLNNPNYQFKHYEKSKKKIFANDFIQIYNQAWAHRPDFVPMTMERILPTLTSLEPVLIEEGIWFAYSQNKPIGFYINVLEVNRLLKYINGRLDFWSKLKFIWYRTFRPIDRMRGIVFGVIPSHQNLGVETGMIMKFYQAMFKQPRLKTIELGWIGDFNPKMHSLFDALGAKTTKVHVTYEKSLFTN